MPLNVYVNSSYRINSSSRSKNHDVKNKVECVYVLFVLYFGTAADFRSSTEFYYFFLVLIDHEEANTE